MTELSKKWLEEKSACSKGCDWFLSQKETNSIKVLKKLMIEKKLDWANWLIVRVMKRKQYLAYAIYAAEQFIKIYEEKYPEDKRPREAIEAAKKCLKKDSKENKDAAYDAAYAAENAAYAAKAAAKAAAYAAYDEKQKMQIKILKYGIKLLERKI